MLLMINGACRRLELVITDTVNIMLQTSDNFSDNFVALISDARFIK